MSYAFWTIVHIIGVSAFQYTGMFTFLIPGIAHIGLSMFIFVLGTAVALNPNFEHEDDDDEDEGPKDYGFRFLLQVGLATTAYQLYLVGYAFFAGMVIIQTLVMAMSVLLQKFQSIKEQ